MKLFSITSPHTVGPDRTQWIMVQVILATIPGLIAQTIYFGWGNLINLFICSFFALAAEAGILKIRRKPILFYLKDASALVTALLFAISVPATLPWWASCAGMIFSILVVKQLYGGLGTNPFNPAMAAYALLLVSFPVQMTLWLPGAIEISKTSEIGVIQNFSAIFTGLINGHSIDTYAMATPLDAFKQAHGNADRLAKAYTLKGDFAGYGWDWINLAFLLGGIYLLWRKIISWHIPISLLLSLFISSLLFWSYDQDNFASPVFHLFSGATMLGAFFIATDPVTAATSNKGRIIYGALIGVLVFIIRTWGGYPEGFAFAILIMNSVVPTLDYYTQPRTFGHKKSNSGFRKREF